MTRTAGALPGRPDRLRLARLSLLIAAPALVTLGSWGWLGLMIGDMSRIPGMASMMMAPHLISPGMVLGLFVMWAVMMAAMMLPTAAPMIVAYARMQAGDRATGSGWLPVAAFSAGYVIVWLVFSLGAAGLQAVLTGLALMSPMVMTSAAPVSGALLIGAGLYQFSPLKQSCLRLCQSPMSFLLTRWQDGPRGALRMGLSHGAYCVGCCWALMGVLFAVGVMNTAWIVAITAYVLAEKVMPRSAVISKALGAGLFGFGLWILAQPLIA
ncbi:MAG: DUF2182 domain-containing protein [Allgaiera sp.]|jgi:predicted metal-binding membrane protein|nr:DUF2182 domain-containing protein [Allgaiera sp.]